LEIDLADLEEVCTPPSNASLFANLCELYQFCLTIEGYENFPEIVQSNARRYASIFAEAADDIMPRRIFGVSDEDDSFDVLMRQVCCKVFNNVHEPFRFVLCFAERSNWRRNQRKHKCVS
jgi:hypothetical protein